jgi:hypothetical protein
MNGSSFGRFIDSLHFLFPQNYARVQIGRAPSVLGLKSGQLRAIVGGTEERRLQLDPFPWPIW